MTDCKWVYAAAERTIGRQRPYSHSIINEPPKLLIRKAHATVPQPFTVNLTVTTSRSMVQRADSARKPDHLRRLSNPLTRAFFCSANFQFFWTLQIWEPPIEEGAYRPILNHRVVVGRHLPRNYFFVSVFVGSALAWCLAALARALLLSWSGQPAMSAKVGEDFLALLRLMGFGEAFINGMLVASAVVYRPRWVMSFEEGSYFAGRG